MSSNRIGRNTNQRKHSMSQAKEVSNGGELKVSFKPKNEAQRLAMKVLAEHEISFLIGPPGTAKSHCSTAWAIQEIDAKRYERFIIVRPAIEVAGEDLGYLPGEVKEKIAPYARPIVDIMKYMGLKVNLPEFVPLAYMRGMTFHNTICILDEAQNCTVKQLHVFLTRMGNGSRMIVNGDIKQTDIRNSGLGKVIERLDGKLGIGVHKFHRCDIVRHKLVQMVDEALEDLL